MPSVSRRPGGRWASAFARASLAGFFCASCAGFDEYEGPGDAGDAGHRLEDATVDRRGGDAIAVGADAIDTKRAFDAPSRDEASLDDASLEDASCASAWTQPAAGATCRTRALTTLVHAVGTVGKLSLARGFGASIALLYSVTNDGGASLVLALVDPTTATVESSQVIASADSFDGAALALDSAGRLAIAYHTTAGAPVDYVAVDGGLSPSAAFPVVRDAGVSQLALSGIPKFAGDAGASVPATGSVGLAWSNGDPAEQSTLSLHLFARTEHGWSEPNYYLGAGAASDLALRPTPQHGMVAAALAFAPGGPSTLQLCTWQMTGESSSCVLDEEIFGLSLAVTPSAVRLVYAFNDPSIPVTTVSVASDSTGAYTFPLVSTLVTLPEALINGAARPRFATVGEGLAGVVAYVGSDFMYRVDFLTWSPAGGTSSLERIAVVASSASDAPPFDVVLDASGALVVAIADAASGDILLARAELAAGADASP